MSIASRIEAIEQHLTDDYNVLEVAGADLTNVNKNILNLKATWQERLLYFMNNGTDVVWNNWDKVTGEGTILTLNNTEEAPMKIDLKGNTYQEGTPTPETPQDIHVVSGDNSIVVCGKNLFNKATVTTGKIVSRTNGTLSDAVSYSASDYIPMAENTTYTLDGGDTSTSSFNRWYSACYDKDKNYIGYVSNADRFTTIPNTRYMRFSVYNDKLDTALLVKGNTLGTYESYTGESYPISLGDIELCKIGDYQDSIKKSTGKNLFDINTPYKDNYFIDATGHEQPSNLTTIYKASCKENNSYSLSFFNNGGESATLRIHAYNNDTWLSQIDTIATNGKNTYSKTFTTPSNANNIRVSYLKTMTELMLNEGTIALPYEPYGTGWYLNKQIGKYTITDSDISLISSYWYNTYGQYGAGILKSNLGLPETSTNRQSLCNISKKIDGQSYINNNTYIFNANANYVFFFSSDFDTKEHANEKLVGANVYFNLDTPTYTEITDSTLLSQLNALAKSYASQTNISQDNNDLPFIISATALKEMS